MAKRGSPGPAVAVYTRGGSWSEALASPLAVLVTIPLLVVGVGGFMALVGQRSLRSSIDTLAEARFADQTLLATRHTAETLGQASGLLEAWGGFLDEHGGDPPARYVSFYLRALMQERRAVSFVSYAWANGDLIGGYTDDEGDLYLTERRVTGDGRRHLRDYAIPAVGDPRLVREDPDCGYDARNRPFFREAVRRGERVWTDPYVFFDSGVPGVTCATPYLDADGDFVGVLAVDFSLNDLSGYIEALNTMSEGRIFVFDIHESLLAYPGFRLDFGRDRRGEGELLTPEAVGDPRLDGFFAHLPPTDDDRVPRSFRFDHGEDTILASVTPCEVDAGLTWYVGALAPESAFMAPAREHRIAAIRVTGVALLVALALAALFAWHLVRSRREVALARAAVRAAKKEIRDMGSYRLVRKLGVGGMGEVWLGEHHLLPRPAAVKLVHGSVLEGLSQQEVDGVLASFQREARVTANLSSPNTVRLFDFGISREGVLFYVMELLDGVDLDRLVREFGPQPAGRVVHLLRQVCSSLAEAHDQGLVHRDVKPSNVFCCRRGEELDVVKVMDFGLVHVRSVDGGSGEASPKVAGTPAYMAPEHCVGETDLDGRTDLYAVGCLAYWLLTGRTVFQRDNPTDMMRDQVIARPSPPSEHAPLLVPRELDRVILRCLEKKPERRFEDARALREALDGVPIPANQGWDLDAMAAWWERHGPDLNDLQDGADPAGLPSSRRLERGATQQMPSEAWESVTLESSTVPKLEPPR